MISVHESIAEFLKGNDLVTEEFEVQPIHGDGSQRVFWRISPSHSKTSYVVMFNPPADPAADRENRAYVLIGRHLRSKGIPVPELHRVDLRRGWFLMEDMGPVSLEETVLTSENPIPLYEKVIATLLRLQADALGGFDTGWCCQTVKYDLFVMRRLESDYFKKAFLSGYLGLKEDWPELESSLRYLAEKASLGGAPVILHRDFQSRNIMVRGEGIGILDWQGARLGPPAYDLASLLLDPYTHLPWETRHNLYDTYLHLLMESHRGLIELFKATFPYLAIQRNLQILGAFGFLTRVRGKGHFEVSIPKALESLRQLVDSVGDRRLSSLGKLVREIQLPTLQGLSSEE
jgi:N-acetylmuramate 1-kinase